MARSRQTDGDTSAGRSQHIRRSHTQRGGGDDVRGGAGDRRGSGADGFAQGRLMDEDGAHGSGRNRGLLERPGEEISSWLGDDDAQRRRKPDHRGKGPKGHTGSDERIRGDVKDRLSDDASVDSPDIGVSVADGEATLTGYVASRQTKRAAEACANRIGGIKHVQNTLRIKTKLAILAVLNGRLARLKHPRRVAFVSAMPRNIMGKVRKNLLRAQFADAGNP